MSVNTDILPAIETMRNDLLSTVNKLCDAMIQRFSPPSDQAIPFVHYKQPTMADGHDPRNKIGQNLTDRGVEILFRVFDDGGGYNRAGKMLSISQGAAKNRKAQWESSGGLKRQRTKLDIDE